MVNRLIMLLSNFIEKLNYDNVNIVNIVSKLIVCDVGKLFNVLRFVVFIIIVYLFSIIIYVISGVVREKRIREKVM